MFLIQTIESTELDRLLGIVVDVENLFMCVHKEEDTDTKQVYFYLFKLLRKCILQMSKPTVEGPLVSIAIFAMPKLIQRIMMNYSFGNQVITVSTFQGNPPFEKPSIAKGVTNFVLFKFGHLPQKDWQTMYDLAKMFLHCLNHWKLETPTARKQLMSSDDISAYKVSTSLYDTNLRNHINCYEVLATTNKMIYYLFRSTTPDGFVTVMYRHFVTLCLIMTPQ